MNLRVFWERYRTDVVLLSLALLLSLVVYRFGLWEEAGVLKSTKEQVLAYRTLLEKGRKRLALLEEKLKALGEGESKGEGVSLPFRNPYELASFLQKELRRAGVSNLSSIRLGRIENWKEYKVVTVSLSFTGDIAALERSLKGIEGKDYLRVARLVVVRVVRGGREELMVKMVVQGLLNGGEQ